MGVGVELDEVLMMLQESSCVAPCFIHEFIIHD